MEMHMKDKLQRRKDLDLHNDAAMDASRRMIL